MARTLDLDAAVREATDGDGIRMPYRGQEFILPAELPLDVFDPFLTDDFDLVGLVRDFLDADRRAKAEGRVADIGEIVVEILFNRPSLPVQVLGAFYDALRAIFNTRGEDGTVVDNFARFQALKPGVTSYALLVRMLLQAYGVGLGEAFTSPGTSTTAGATSKPTSPGSTPGSTPETSSAPQEPTEASSVSDGSATS